MEEEKYTTVKGDTLFGIAKKYNVSLEDLVKNNNLEGMTLKIGQEIIIPKDSDLKTTMYITYNVKKGDSLYSIARVYNTTVDEIKKLNNLKTNNLNIGQQIFIPDYEKTDNTPINDYINYKVKKGDSLYSIAKKYKTTVNDIMKDNNIGEVDLKIDQELVIKTKDKTPSYESCYGEEYIPTSKSNYMEYTVKKGDSIYSIAKNYNVSVNEIKNINNLSSNLLNIGQKLNLPVVNQTYTVEKGDSLYSIAKKFNTTADNIKRKNDLQTNSLSIGQKLVI